MTFAPQWFLGWFCTNTFWRFGAIFVAIEFKKSPKLRKIWSLCPSVIVVVWSWKETHDSCRFRHSGYWWRLQEERRRVLNVTDLDDEVVDGHVAAVESLVGPRILKVKEDNFLF